MLEVRDLRVRYGAVEAVRGISLTVREGELVALIGSNGAGKSSCLKALAGIIRPVGGSIRLDGDELAAEPAHRIVGRGIVLVPEGRRLFGDQTVMDNLLLGAYGRRDREGDRQRRARAAQHLEQFPILRERQHLPAGTLSGGEQQMLAISRGLMASPRLLLLDEPSLGLAPLLVRQIFEIIAALRREGRTILLVEQMARLALRAADRAYVLVQGRIALEGPAEELLAHPDVVRGYLGRATARGNDTARAAAETPIEPTTGEIP
jgi:branched-chain amino acid transport system ATP-binding protein